MQALIDWLVQQINLTETIITSNRVRGLQEAISLETARAATLQSVLNKVRELAGATA